MDREILFRGKRADNGEWVHGLLCQYHEEISAKIVPNDFGCFYDKMVWVVDPETVGRYTGLTDKNGTKIFEGDIIKEKGKKKNAYLVEYSKNIAGFITRGFGVLSTPCMNVGTMKFYEVIGNIHDNPELMKGE